MVYDLSCKPSHFYLDQKWNGNVCSYIRNCWGCGGGGDGSGIENKEKRQEAGGTRERMPDAKMFRSRAISLHALWRKEPKREEI